MSTNTVSQFGLVLLYGIQGIILVICISETAQIQSDIDSLSHGTEFSSVMVRIKVNAMGQTLRLLDPRLNASIYADSAANALSGASSRGMSMRSTLTRIRDPSPMYNYAGHDDACVSVADTDAIGDYEPKENYYTRNKYVQVHHDSCQLLTRALGGLHVDASVYFPPPGKDWLNCENHLQSIGGKWAGFYCQPYKGKVYVFCPDTETMDDLVPPCIAHKHIEEDTNACCPRATSGKAEFTVHWEGVQWCVADPNAVETSIIRCPSNNG